jgi:hypothetical protein
MNLKTLVKMSNIVAAISILLLIYWVFTFIAIEVFGFRIFRENLSQTFAMSVLGILALMGGSLMINVMFNLTRIAQKHNQDEIVESRRISKHLVAAFVLTFPLIFGFLFAGDYLTSKKKESMLLSSARSIVETNTEKSARLVNYQFTDAWLNDTRDTLSFFEDSERNFPHASVIVQDSIDGSPAYLAIREYSSSHTENGQLIEPVKRRFLMKTTKADRDYLDSVFNGEVSQSRFTASDGSYELFYPFSKEGKKIVLYFSDYQRYGKMGS